MNSVKTNDLIRIIRSFKGQTVTVFGDIMIDHFIRGRVERISPEAPVPVVHVQKETFLPGGAGNVACNLSALGANVRLVAVIGNDSPGGNLLESLRERGVDVSGVVQDTRRPTTEKVRVIAEHQQVVRFDRESSEKLAPAISRRCLENMNKALRASRGVVLSDYGKGVLSDDNIKAVIAGCIKNKVHVCVDPKTENFKKYRKVSCITPNTKEAWEGMHLPPKQGQDKIEDLGRKILKTLDSRTVLITQGANGMTLFENARVPMISHTPTVAREVFDVTGAGDTVISVFTLALAAGASYKQAAVLSNHAAGIVVGKLGTATTTAEELLEALKK